MDQTTDNGATGADAGGDAGDNDLKSAIEQLQATADQFQAQVQAVASAAGVSTGKEGGPDTEKAPGEETQEPPAEAAAEPPAEGGNSSLAAFMTKPKMRM